MKIEQKNIQSMRALLCNACGVDAQKTKSLCCEAAGIIDPFSATAEALIPHEKLREAASVDATLIARERPPAQPAVGYMPFRVTVDSKQADAQPASAWLLVSHPDGAEWTVRVGSKEHDRALRPGHLAIEPLYTHTDSGEIERCYEHALKALEAETDTLRAKLSNACQVGIVKSQEAKAYFALLKRITGNDYQDSLRAIAEAAILLTSSEPCVHEFIPFTSGCSKCGEPYASTAHSEHAKPVTISRIRESMEESASSGNVAELQIGATHVRVTYHGIKWYHDRMRNGRWEPLAIQEFDEILCSHLKHEVSHD